MKKISVGNGKFALVDDNDYAYLNKYKWHIVGGYAQTSSRSNGNRVNIYMHRMILNPPNGFVVDHKNGNPLDNRRANIRICSRSENQCNQKPSRGVSKYRGVFKKRDKWGANITKEKSTIFLGYFETEIEAARAYDKASIEFHGEFGIRNFTY